MTTVYVSLLDEGVEVWRPVDAVPLGGDRYRLLGSVPDYEQWQFKPGDIVRCETRRLSGDYARLNDCLVAVEKSH